MPQAEFSVHLGGGLYMNSRGELSHGPEPGKPVYSTPGGGLPVNPDAFAKAFQGIAKALPDKKDPKSREKFDEILDGIGMAADDKEHLIEMLQGIGAVASVIGSAVPVVGAALAVLTALLGLFKEGPTALELMIERRFDDLQRTAKSLETQITQRDLRNQKSSIATALAAISNYLKELENTPPDEAELSQRRQDMRNQIAIAATAVRNLLGSSTWLSTFDINEQKSVWPWMTNRLYTFPTGTGPQRAMYPSQGANVFDHRLMVPLSAYGITTFLTILRAYAPEFRSTRHNREDLWDFAQALETLITNMRQEGLARTLYVTADFEGGAGGIPWGLGPEEVIDLSIFGQPPRLAPDNTRFSVGALDLRFHNDVYFTPGFSASTIQLPGPQYAKQGLLDVRWQPPAKLEAYDEPVPVLGWEPANQPPPTRRRYRITNPEECAKAANAQAEKNFSDLLFSSGYLNLVHLLAALRHEATDPDRSQTVRSEAWLRRKSGASTAVTVESEPILLTGVISANADSQPQEYKATTWFTTQPLGRDRKLSYRVFLRTLSAAFSVGGSSISEQDYGTYHQVGYTDDPAHPGCKKLFTTTGQPLAELEIAHGTTVPETLEQNHTAVLEAITYDYWIPVKPLGLVGDLRETAIRSAALRASGWEADGGRPASSVSPPPLSPALPTHGGGAAPGGRGSIALESNIQDVRLTEFLGWTEGAAPPSAQHRRAQKSEVHLDYSLRWQADRLTVTLSGNRLEDRNYVVYVVVEETLRSGEVLHTIERVPVTGQLTFVPQSFFDEESAAREKVARVFRDFEQRYAESIGPEPRPGGPGDPDPGWRLGLDRQQFTTDPVMQAFGLVTSGSQQDLARMTDLVLRHPSAAAVLRQVLADADVPMDHLMHDAV
jgi:hypothetical protein